MLIRSIVEMTVADRHESYEHHSLQEPAILYVKMHVKLNARLTEMQTGRVIHGGYCRDSKMMISQGH